MINPFLHCYTINYHKTNGLYDIYFYSASVFLEQIQMTFIAKKTSIFI